MKNIEISRTLFVPIKCFGLYSQDIAYSLRFRFSALKWGQASEFHPEFKNNLEYPRG